MRPNPLRLLCKVTLSGLVLLAGHGTPTARPPPEVGGEPAPAVLDPAVASPEVFPFSEVDVTSDHSCGVRTDGVSVCWGNGEYGELDAPEGTFGQVSTGEYHTCGLRMDGTVACWGNNDAGQLSAPGGRFSQASAGTYHSCGLTAGGTVTCWGIDTNGRLDQECCQTVETRAVRKMSGCQARTYGQQGVFKCLGGVMASLLPG